MPDAEAMFDQFGHRSPRPQRIGHLQLIRRLVADQPADFGFLLPRQAPTFSALAPADNIAQCLSPARRVTFADVEYPGTAEPGLLRNRFVCIARRAQPNHLHAPLMPRFAWQRSHVGCFHYNNVWAARHFSRALLPDQ